MKSKLTRFSEMQVNDIMDMYYHSKKPISNILRLYNIDDITAGNLYKHFPPIVSDSRICAYCRVPLIKKRPPKSENYNFNDFFCPICQRSEFKYIDSKKLNKVRNDTERISMLVLRHINNQEFNDISIDDISLKQKIYLAALLKGADSHRYDMIDPISSFMNNLSPTKEYDDIIFSELFRNKIIRIHPTSVVKPNNFIVNESLRFKRMDVTLSLNINYSDDDINSLLKPSYTLNDELVNLWNEVIYWECIEVFLNRMIEFKFEYKVGIETKTFFESIIPKLPIAQIYSIIWRAIQKSQDYYGEANGNTPKRIFGKMAGLSKKLWICLVMARVR